MENKERLAFIVAVGIFLTWVAGALVGSVTGDYTIFQISTGLMFGVAGWLFGLSVFKNGKRGNGAP